MPFTNQTGNSNPATVNISATFINRAIAPPPPSPSPPPLPPVSGFATNCEPGTFEYALGTASLGKRYATSSNLQAVLPAATTPVSITLCAGTTVANAALIIASGSSVSIGCTRITTPPSCVLDGGGLFQILFVGANAELTLTGLALNNGTSTGSGGAVFVSAGATLVANGDAFKKDTAVYGGAVAESSAAVNVSNTTFSSDAGNFFGGAVYARRGTVVAFNASFTHDRSGYAGGAVAESSAAVNVSNAVFTTDTATSYGGAVYARRGTVAAFNASFIHDRAGYAGGAVFESNAAVDVSNASFTSGTAYAGGAVYASGGTVAAFNASFTMNSAGVGGALYEYNAVINATNASFVGGVSTYGARCERATRRLLSIR